MTANIIYTGGLRTVCTHIKSNTTIQTDAPTDNNGKGERFSPTDLLATSLGACMITVMGIKARDMGFDLNDIHVEVQKEMAQEPRRVNAVYLKFHFPENLKHIDQKHIHILKNTAHTCPVAKSLHPDLMVQIDWSDWA